MQESHWTVEFFPLHMFLAKQVCTKSSDQHPHKIIKIDNSIQILKDFDRHQAESALNSEHCLHAQTEERGATD